MAVFGDFFDSLFGGPDGVVRRMARTFRRQYGQGALDEGTEESPTDWERFARVRGGWFHVARSYVEAVGNQAYPHLAEYAVEVWEELKNVPPGPATQTTGERLERIVAYCQTMMGSRPVDIETAIENLVGVGGATIHEHTAVQCAPDPDRIFDFWTLVSQTNFDNESLRDDINEIVSRWMPAHTHHGASTSAAGAASRHAGGVRVGVTVGDYLTPILLVTGSGPEKTGQNLIKYSP